MGRFCRFQQSRTRSGPARWLSCSAVLTLLLLASDPRPSTAVDVNVAVLLPFNDSYLFSYRRVAPAIEKAIKYLNQETQLLRKHRLIVRYNDTKCSISEAIDRAINFFIRREVNVFFGPVCDFALAPVARQIHFWNIPLISGGAMAWDFFKYRTTTYHMLTRVGPVNFDSLTSFLSEQARYFRWRNLKLVYSRDGQDVFMHGLCHLTTEAVHYALKEKDPDLRQDYYRLEEHKENLDSLLRQEVGLEYAGTTRFLKQILALSSHK